MRQSCIQAQWDRYAFESKRLLFVMTARIALWSPSRLAAAVTVDAAQSFQIIEGFGVNANHRAWNNDELKPVLDQLIDNGGMTQFRVVYDNADWETNNDNGDPNVMNGACYTRAYTNFDFQKMWSMMAYLNQKGISNGLMPNFQGFGPAWIAYPFPNNRTLASGKENEWAEMIASGLGALHQSSAIHAGGTEQRTRSSRLRVRHFQRCAVCERAAPARAAVGQQ